MEQNLNDKPLSNMQITRYIESLKKEMNFDDEVYGLVKSDLEDGLTQEQTEKYLDKNFNIGQMKVLSEGLHKDIPEELDRRINMITDTVISVDYAMNNIVVKTYPGMASAVAASVDASMRNEFLGSIAGDDTLLIIARNEEKAAEIAEKLIQLFQ